MWRGRWRWWRRRSLRARLTIVATLLLALGLAGGAKLMVTSLARSLTESLDVEARQRVRDVAAQVRDGRLPDPVPVVGDGVLVQVVDPAGRVVAASAGADRDRPLLEPAALAAARPGSGRFVKLGWLRRDVPLWAVVEAVGDRRVIAAVSYQTVDSSIHTVAVAFLVGVPLLLVFVAGASWLLVGSALRPVDSLRRGAEEISGTAAGRRLPVPPARDEVHRLALTLNQMLDRLDAAATRQRAFVGDAAHELRSPLAAIRTQIEVSLHHPSTADWPRTGTNVLADTLRLGRLVDDLLLLAKLDEGALAARTDAVDLAGLAEAAVARVRPRAAVTVVPAGGPGTGGGPATVRGDSDALLRVVANLLDNAVRYAVARVEVAVRVDAGCAVVEVRDDGPGVPPSDRERVFARFTRLDDARGRDAGGAGLGLAIARDVARAHGGDVRFVGTGSGACVELRLPAVPSPVSTVPA